MFSKDPKPPVITKDTNETKDNALEHVDGGKVNLPIGWNLLALSGSHINIECVGSGIPRPEVTWYKDGEELSVDERDNMVTRYEEELSVLEVYNADTSDSGRYTCNVTNLAGTVTESSDVEVSGMILCYGSRQKFHCFF